MILMPSLGSKMPKPAFLTGEEKKLCNKERSVIHENRLQKVVRSKVTPNSGALPNISQKGDLQDGLFVWQAKLTEKDNFKLTSDVIVEICRQASLNSKWPAIVLTLEALPKHIEKDWVVLPANVFQDLIDTYKDRN